MSCSLCHLGQKKNESLEKRVLKLESIPQIFSGSSVQLNFFRQQLVKLDPANRMLAFSGFKKGATTECEQDIKAFMSNHFPGIILVADVSLIGQKPVLQL